MEGAAHRIRLKMDQRGIPREVTEDFLEKVRARANIVRMCP